MSNQLQLLLKSHLTVIVIIIFSIMINIKCETNTGKYSVSAPGTIRPNSIYNVAVSVHIAEPVEFQIGIVSPTFSKYETVNVPEWSTNIVKFELGDIPQDDYNLTIDGIKGIEFKNETKLNYDGKTVSVLMQTDKAMYKPSDLVRFRILILDRNTRPAKLTKPVSLIIRDGNQNTIRQDSNLEILDGVYSDDLLLSDLPILGSWSIIVHVGSEEYSKNFEVAEYVLPKYEVTIDVPKDLTPRDDSIRIIVRAKYTYGKSVKGDVTVTLDPASWRQNREETTQQKTVPIDGKASLEFPIDKKNGTPTEYYYKVKAIVKESLTGKELNVEDQFSIHTKIFDVTSLSVQSYYVPDSPFLVSVKVSKHDGSPVVDSTNKLKLDVYQGYYKENVTFSDESNLDKDGVASFKVKLPNTEKNVYTIYATYLGEEHFINRVSKKENETGSYFRIEIQTEKPNLDKDVSIKLESSDNLQYLVYQIVGRGNILLAGTEKVPDRNYHIFKITPTFQMVPRAKIFIYTIRNGELVYAEESIEFDKRLENYIKLSAPDQLKPGQEAEIRVDTEPESFVGLAAVDQSVLLLKSGNDLNIDDTFSELYQFDTHSPSDFMYGPSPGSRTGVVFLTDAHYPREPYSIHPIVLYSSADMAGVPSLQMTVRKDFSETWIWENISNSGRESGELSLTRTVPDTITSWVITGFSLNPSTGLGLTKNPTKLRVFQPFFVSTNLPYSVKRGEVISIPVSIFNYMDNDVEAEITLENEDNEFEFTESEKTNDVAKDSTKRTRQINVAIDSAGSVSFMIRPLVVGQILLKIKGVSPLAGDAIEQLLRVEPEGVTQYTNKATLVDLRTNKEFSQELEIDLPNDIVPDSLRIEASIVGDILGPTIQNLDKLVRMPYGCGEQNMVNFVPNILVLKYFKTTGETPENIKTKAIKFMEVGYQRELTYKHPDGSYSAFGPKDSNGSTWLTAYVARSFRQAADFITIDEEVIKSALNFLITNQAENGSFIENGKLFDQRMSSSTDKGIGLTAFTLLAFIENGKNYPEYKSKMNKAFDYILSNLDNNNDAYTLAISAYAFQLNNHSSKDIILDKLKSKATIKDDRMWWEKSEPEVKPKYCCYRPNTANVEMTGYGLLAYLYADLIPESLPIAKWLVANRNSHGGFESTQDTVVGLMALTKFSENLESSNSDVQITLSYGPNGKSSSYVNKDNAVVLQTYELPSDIKTVRVDATGKGSALVQVSYRYNINKTEASPSFTIEPKVVITPSKNLELTICTSYVPGENDIDQNSNMAVMEANMPTGYNVDKETLKNLIGKDNIKKVETKNGDQIAVIYFDSLSKDKVCVKISADRLHMVADQKPSAIKVYDYYDNDRQARVFYSTPETSISEILCDSIECAVLAEQKEQQN